MKFVVPFQGGFDGTNPAKEEKKEQILQQTTHKGLIISASASGSIKYKRAINAVSNPDEYDINLLSLPWC